MLEQRHFLADHNLLYTDKLTMAHGVEARVPFLDPDLVSFVNSLPPRVKQRRGIGKWLLKQVLSDYLPAEIVHRSKTGFGAPLRQWVRKDLVPVIDSLLSQQELSRRGVFHAANARRLIEWDRAGRVDASYTVYAMLCMELWFRTFLDPAQPTEIVDLPGL
jgi:asparagine synthase (glutamine-hydrolysing)